MNITAGAVIILVIVICGVLFFRTKTGKHVKLRAAGTAEEVIQKDAGFRGEGGPQGGLLLIGEAAAVRIFRHEGQKGF